MSQTVNLDRAEIAQAELTREGVPVAAAPLGTVAEVKAGEGHIDITKEAELSPSDDGTATEFDDLPTEEEMHTLRRVSGKIKWSAYSIAFCELAERFSYYGSTILYTNFIQWPLPDGPGHNTGAGHSGQSGALGMGQQAATGLVLFNQFFAYLMPLLG